MLVKYEFMGVYLQPSVLNLVHTWQSDSDSSGDLPAAMRWVLPDYLSWCTSVLTSCNIVHLRIALTRLTLTYVIIFVLIKQSILNTEGECHKPLARWCTSSYDTRSFSSVQVTVSDRLRLRAGFNCLPER